MNSLLNWLSASSTMTWGLSAVVGFGFIPAAFAGDLLAVVLVIALAAWPLAFAWYGRSRLIVLSGLLTGFGLAWLVMTIVAQTEARIVEPTLWLAIGVVGVAAGLGLGVLIANGLGAPVGSRRRSQPELRRDDSTNYFRDLSGRAPGQGVQEEEDVRRWGSGERQ